MTIGLPNILGLWIPVVDATSENGCMFVVPRERDRCVLHLYDGDNELGWGNLHPQIYTQFTAPPPDLQIVPRNTFTAKRCGLECPLDVMSENGCMFVVPRERDR